MYLLLTKIMQGFSRGFELDEVALFTIGRDLA